MPLVQLASEGDHGSALTNNGFRICTSSHTSCKDVTDFALVHISISTSSLSFLFQEEEAEEHFDQVEACPDWVKALLDSVVWHIVAGGNSLVEEMHV